MPHFFDKSELSPEHAARYQQAVIEYELIQKANIDHIISKLTDEDRVCFREQGQINDEQIRIFYTRAKNINSGTDKSKSALFFRLLDGKKPLAIAPPTSFSYPWYEVIEGDGPWTITTLRGCSVYSVLDDLKTTAFDYATSTTVEGLSINQSCWTLLNSISDIHATVTFGEWASFGFTWSLMREAVPAATSTNCLACWHDKSIGRITTIDQIKAENQYLAQASFDPLKWALDPLAADEFLKSRRQISNFEGYAANNEVERGRKLLAQRRHDGLGDTPGRDEVESLAAQLNSDAFASGEMFDTPDGQLHFYEWRLHPLTKGSLS